MDSHRKPPKIGYLLFAAIVFGAVAVLGSIGRLNELGGALFSVACAVAFAIQLKTGYPFSRLIVPGPHRTDDPTGYWVSVGLAGLALVFSLLFSFWAQ